ncbi:hypothetical protein [Nocardia sp. NPDC051750]|uniref:hypothetical protein n=1 Tax=Nocardia sp. NPDC051750 TaxID=3364325 RepID=UPI0037B1CFA9
MAQALTASRRLAEALAAIDDELLIAARNTSPALSWRALGALLDRHWTTVEERVSKFDQGHRAIKRGWLLGTPPPRMDRP